MAEALKAPTKNLKADVWKYFGFKNHKDGKELEKSKAVCKICSVEVKYCRNTTNLRNHLTRHHPETQTAQKQMQLDKAFEVKLPANSPRAQKITKAVATYICKSIQPYCVVENDGFRCLMKTLEPRYVIPTRKQFSEVTIPNMYADVKNDIATSLTSAERVALTCDCWTSRATESYLTITAHYIDNDWNLMWHVLQTRSVETSHIASNLRDILCEAIREWELTNKEPVIVTDNAANIVRAVEMMDLLHVGCFAHILNLASQAALKIPAVARLLGRVRRIASFFHRSTTASHKLKEKQTLLGLPLHKLVIDVVTRWNSSLEMLDRFLEQQPAVSAALLSPEVRRNEKDLCTLTEADVTVAEDEPCPQKKQKKSSALMFLLGSVYKQNDAASLKTLADKAQEEVNRYREETHIPLSENPLHWWKVHAGAFPLLARQAKRYLCVPGTSVPSERVFSAAGDIVTAKRSCLTSQHVDQLLFLQKNLQVDI
uniref:BED-type domain-containing protein n=1 Tax=Amphiprion ocellaris TaxID=80972 RepID=A0A3Q1BI66_AMPOC